jgi:hypothetical protein
MRTEDYIRGIREKHEGGGIAVVWPIWRTNQTIMTCVDIHSSTSYLMSLCDLPHDDADGLKGERVCPGTVQ